MSGLKPRPPENRSETKLGLCRALKCVEPASEIYPRRELHAAHPSGSRNLAEGGGAQHRGQARIIHMIEQIGGVPTEIETTQAIAPKLNRLGQPCIDGERARADYCIPRGVAETFRWCLKCRRVEPLLHRRVR